MLHFEDVRVCAARIRAIASVAEPPFSTRGIVQAAFPDALVTGGALPGWAKECVTVTDGGPLIVYRRGMSSPEQRIAIAHAVGHLVYDLDAREGSNLDRCEVRERRADDFAAELLAPLDFLRCYVAPRPSGPAADEIWLDMIDEIASHFQVPAEVIASQIDRLSP